MRPAFEIGYEEYCQRTEGPVDPDYYRGDDFDDEPEEDEES